MWQSVSGLRLTALALVAGVTIAACEPGEDSSTFDTAAGGDVGIGARGDREMSQPMALGTIAAVHSSEIASGELAQQRAQNAQVRQFAQQVAQEHQAFLQQLRGLNLTIDTTGADPELVQMADSTMQRLRSLQGAAFDTAWVNAQVMMHEAALERAQRIADQDFSDTTSRAGQTRDTSSAGANQQLSEYLDNTTELIERHLDEARRLQERLREGSGTGN